jgi:hypothetical protein
MKVFSGLRGLILFFSPGGRIVFTGKRNVVETPKDKNVKIIQSPHAALGKIKSVARQYY